MAPEWFISSLEPTASDPGSAENSGSLPKAQLINVADVIPFVPKGVAQQLAWAPKFAVHAADLAAAGQAGENFLQADALAG